MTVAAGTVLVVVKTVVVVCGKVNVMAVLVLAVTVTSAEEGASTVEVMVLVVKTVLR